MPWPPTTHQDVQDRIVVTGGIPLPMFSGRWSAYPGGSGTSALTADTLMFVPVVFAEPMTLDGMGVHVATAATGSVIRLGIYNNSGGVPGSLLVDADTQASATIGAKAYTISQAVSAGLFWLAAVGQGGAPAVRGNSIGNPQIGASSTSLADVAGAVVQGYSQAGVTGALPANASGTLTMLAANVPRIAVKRS